MSTNDIVVLLLIVTLVLVVVLLAVYFFQETLFGPSYKESTTESKESKESKDKPKKVINIVTPIPPPPRRPPRPPPHHRHKNRDPSCTTAKYGVREREYGDYDPEDDVYGSCKPGFASSQCRYNSQCIKGSRLKSGCGVNIEGDLFGCPSSCCKPYF